MKIIVLSVFVLAIAMFAVIAIPALATAQTGNSINYTKTKQAPENLESILIETRYENLVQALVPLDNLILLSEDENINYIRTPLPAYPQETSESETQIPLTLIWICVGIIIVIIAVTAVVYLKTGLKR